MVAQGAKMEPPGPQNDSFSSEKVPFPEGSQSTVAACKLTFQLPAACRKGPAAGGEAIKCAAAGPCPAFNGVPDHS